MKKTTLFTILFSCLMFIPIAAQQNKGELSNLVCFLRFSDEEADVFEKTPEYYRAMFNDNTPGANSVYNYFREASYGQLSWKSVFYPAAADTRIVSFQASHVRKYYEKKSDSNPEGYVDDELGANALLREQKLVKELADYLNTIIPADAMIDANNDNVIDNICIIVSGRSALSGSHLLWPHRSTLYTQEGYIHGKRVNEYIMLFDEANGYDSNWNGKQINTGVLCHEMSHTLGTYDLYHSSYKDLNPVGIWDLMSDNQTTPQGMMAYTKYKYCKWIDEIPEISEPGTYTLNPVGGSTKENVAYKIKPMGSDEYFIVEYRKKEGTFESGLPASGLLIYRINPKFTGNEGYNGSTKLDEQYIFRPGGTTTKDGNIEKAFFSLESGRTVFGGTAEEKPFYSDGKEAKFAIGNISACGETMTFDLLPFASQIYLPQPNVSLSGVAGSSTQVKIDTNIDWKVSSLPNWLTVEPMQGAAGNVTLTFTTKSQNEDASERSGEVRFEGADDASVFAIASVSQKSGFIQPPYDLSASKEGTAVTITWKAPLAGMPVFTEDFENEAAMQNWTIKKSTNSHNWVRQEATTRIEPYDGSFVAYLGEDMDYTHQDEWLISPKFSNGKSLTFYSKSTAPQKKTKHNFYYVMVSNDDGVTWNKVYDLVKEGEETVPLRYVRIDVDLSAYQSENMRVAFHAFDDNNDGLYYWWMVDGISVYPGMSSTITGYEIYRNDVKIGISDNCSFTDTEPLEGTAVYTVKALGDFGETAFSEPLAFNGESGIIDAVTENVKIYPTVVDNIVTIESEMPIGRVSVYSLTGTIVKDVYPDSLRYESDFSNLASGIYVICICSEDGTILAKSKLIKR
ncbi:M6 family metalloprotease domain-containing protein [Coprobacter sp. LH1063]|uniref:M6 family metalloprotease domain-containing protein n=2 Tax=Coprobacter tertius TaxID=2944915 RepID=A0ABT1MGM0_9BACT|nr:M6 family metalloprotease domain-containing protein [Coprobacter tertius]